MKLRSKILFSISIRSKVYFVIALILVLFIVGFIIFERITERRSKIYNCLQKEEVIKSVSAILSYQTEFMKRISYDYSCYDWLCDYVKNPDSISAEKNISSPDLLGIDLFGVFNLNQKLVLEQFSLKIGADSLSFDNNFFETLNNNKFLSFYQSSAKRKYLLVATTINPSTDTNKNAAARGFLIIGKVIDSTFLGNIGELLSCKLNIIDTLNQLPKEAGIHFTLKKYNNQEIGYIAIAKTKNYNELIRPLNVSIKWLILITFVTVSLVIFIAHRKIVLVPLLTIERALNKNSEKEVRKLMYKRDEYGKIARLIIRFFLQRNILTNKIDELLRTKDDLKFLNNQLHAQKEELQTSANNLLEANESIQLQKKLITDNIYYASIVQRAALIPSIDISEVFSEHFIIFKPKDVISGDFYWFKKMYGKYYIAVSDCTGHGLSGALMSMLGISFLNQIVTLPGSDEFTAAEILYQLRSFVVQSLHQQGESIEVHDGMDIALCIFDFETMNMEFSAAYNSLYILRKGGNSNEYKLAAYKGDSMPVGTFINNDVFTNHKFSISKGDILYLFTDGIVDQFGGPDDKKFMAKNFKELLLSNIHFPLEKQREIIEHTFEKWKGYNFQVDDVTMVGLKI